MNRLLAAAAFALTLAGPALAAEETVPTIVVSTRSVDFADARAVEGLYARLQHAARIVCEDAGGYGLSGVAAQNRCRAEALSRAVARIDRPELYALAGQANIRLARR